MTTSSPPQEKLLGIRNNHMNPIYKKELEALEDLKCVNGAMYFGSTSDLCKGDCCPNEQTYEQALAELKSFLLSALQRSSMAVVEASLPKKIQNFGVPMDYYGEDYDEYVKINNRFVTEYNTSTLATAREITGGGN